MEVLLAATIVFCAASVEGAIGFGAGLIAIAFLPLFWEVPYVVAVLSPVSVVLTGSLVFQLRKHVEFGDVRGLLWPMPLGVGVGLWARFKGLSRTLTFKLCPLFWVS